MRRAYAVPLGVLISIVAAMFGVAVIVLFCSFVLLVLPLLGCVAAASTVYRAITNMPSGELDNTGLFELRAAARTRRTRIAAPPADVVAPVPVPRRRTVELS